MIADCAADADLTSRIDRTDSKGYAVSYINGVAADIDISVSCSLDRSTNAVMTSSNAMIALTAFFILFIKSFPPQFFMILFLICT